MAKLHYAFYLDDPATPSFCSFDKLYVGTQDSIGKCIEKMRAESHYPYTVEAYDRYLAGEQDAEHYVAYAPRRLLTPVRVLHATSFEMGSHAWEHINTWECGYNMRFEHATIHQVLIKHKNKYHRCVRAEITDLCYEATCDWQPLSSGFWGHDYLLEVRQLPGEHFVFSNTLYVEEDQFATKEEAIVLMSDPSKVVFDRICDEIFGDG